MRATLSLVTLLLLAACDPYPTDPEVRREPQLGKADSGDEPVPRISFLASWDEVVFGIPRQGGQLSIDYSLERLPGCRGTHNGHPAWDLVAHARFLPGGQEASGSVRVFESPLGTPTNVAHSQPLTLEIPAQATAVEIWFHNFTGAGSSCQAWDSNLDQNYRFEISPPASDPRCQGIERWDTINSDMPYASSPHCLAYDVDEHFDAGYCELFLDGIGDGYMGHYGIPNHWVEAYLHVGPQQGTLLGAGLLTRYRDPATGAVHERVVMGRQVAPDTWQSGFIYDKPGYMGEGGFTYTVEEMAFFIDVRRSTGKVVRLWQSRHGQNYRWMDAFGLPTVPKSIPYGNIQYAADGASIFDARRSCGH